MPIASILESNTPFGFATSSHSNGASNDSPTKSSAPRSTINHSNLPSSPLERDSYYGSSLHGGINHLPLNGLHYQASPHDVSKHPATKNAHGSNDIAYPSSASTITPININSRLPSPKLTAPMLSTTTPTTPITPQSRSTFPSQLAPLHLEDISYPSLSNHESASTRHQTRLTTEYHHVKTEDIDTTAPLHTNSLTCLPPPQPTITEVTGTLPPLTDISRKLYGNSNVTTPRRPLFGLIDDGDSGYFDGSTTENRRLKRRKELNQRIDGLNTDFSINKERIFAEKLLVVQNEVGQARNSSHIQYQEDLMLLESMRQKSLEGGRLFRNYQIQIADNQFMSEMECAEEEYLTEQHEVREKLFMLLEEKRRKLKEDRDNCDLAYDVPLETQTRMNKRNLRKRGTDGDGKLNKRKQISSPSLVFRLKDEEIYDDLQAMRNGLGLPVKKSLANKKK